MHDGSPLNSITPGLRRNGCDPAYMLYENNEAS